MLGPQGAAAATGREEYRWKERNTSHLGQPVAAAMGGKKAEADWKPVGWRKMDSAEGKRAKAVKAVTKRAGHTHCCLASGGTLGASS